MKKLLLLLICLWLTNNSFSQVLFGKDYRGNQIVEVSINNIIKIMELSSSEFKNIILSKGYNLSTVEDECNNYVKGGSDDGTIHEVSKCSMHLFTIGWFSIEDGKSNISGFIDEIEKYYAGYDKKMQMSYYQVKKNNGIYNFYISRKGSTESVYCKKVN